ncbi:PDZ domain-containing protein [Ruegeria arenilitoris]|uniref:PDZ domain-containing protein n=1 Tax=Ruegeria arenilitoris TaxID=1173585 RepID=UPI00147F03BC|nr:PDZ domain-containing protein [Ruegeria arenilitoris]
MTTNKSFRRFGVVRAFAPALMIAVAISAPVFAQDLELTEEDRIRLEAFKAFQDNIAEFLPTVNKIDPGILPITIPFREVREHVIVDVDFGNGVALPFMFDTGAPTYVTPEIASVHGGDVIVEAGAVAAGNKLTWSPMMRMSDITLGGKLPISDPTGEIGWSSEGAFYCITTNGLIGAPLMRNAVWQINYGTQEITVAAEVGQLDHIDGAIALPFTHKENSSSPTPHVELGVGDGILEFVVDTGGGIPLTINSADLASVGVALAEDAPRTGVLAGGAAGSFEMQLVAQTIPIRFGDTELMVPITVGDGMAPGANGNVGHTFLKNFVVTFDWSTRMIHLDPLFEGNSLPALPEPSAAAIGLEGSEVQVTSVPKGGPADAAGLRLGEVVTKVNGKDITDITPDAFCELTDGEIETITTASGQTYDASRIEGFFGDGQ